MMKREFEERYKTTMDTEFEEKYKAMEARCVHLLDAMEENINQIFCKQRDTQASSGGQEYSPSDSSGSTVCFTAQQERPSGFGTRVIARNYSARAIRPAKCAGRPWGIDLMR